MIKRYGPKSGRVIRRGESGGVTRPLFVRLMLIGRDQSGPYWRGHRFARLLLRSNILLAAHIWTESRWNTYGAIGLLVGLKQGQHDAGRSDGGIVERVDELYLAIFVTIADIHSTGLPLVEVRT